MEYGCRVRALIRTVGIAAGLTLAASASAKSDSRAISREVASNPNSVLSRLDATGRIDRDGGVAEGEGGADRTAPIAPCTLSSATQCQDSPAPLAPVSQLINGQFNFSQFEMWDDFIVGTAGSATSVCWEGSYGDDNLCGLNAVPMSDPIDFLIWTVRYYDTFLGLPGSVIAAFTDGDAGVTVSHGLGAADLGNPPDPQSFRTQWTMSHPAVALSANTCYWVSFDQVDQPLGPGCPAVLTMSYEGTIGNRRSLRYDNELPDPFTTDDLIADDMMAVTFSEQGYVKRTPLSTYRSQGRGGRGKMSPACLDPHLCQYRLILGLFKKLQVCRRRPPGASGLQQGTCRSGHERHHHRDPA